MAQQSKSNENLNLTTTIENGNRFGRGIEFHKGTPVQLLRYSEESRNGNFGQIVLNPEALNILQTIRETNCYHFCW